MSSLGQSCSISCPGLSASAQDCYARMRAVQRGLTGKPRKSSGLTMRPVIRIKAEWTLVRIAGVRA